MQEQLNASMIEAGLARERARGALVDLVVGDAVGTTAEFFAPGTFEPLTDMAGGGLAGARASAEVVGNSLGAEQSILYETLNRALSLMRPHNTSGSITFTDWLFQRLPDRLRAIAWHDAAGNQHVDSRTHDGHKTLFVAHVDTVHRIAGANRIRKTTSTWFADGAVLGADDGVGCALLMHMLHAAVPGYYVFTQGEEMGGIGARHLACEYQLLLAEFDRAVAFDRRGTDSIITRQRYGRCCSDVFGEALSAELLRTDEALVYSLDETGVYTDTAEFTDVIPECTNISCGYLYEHSEREQLDMIHFDRLAEAAVVINWDSLPTARDPEWTT